MKKILYSFSLLILLVPILTLTNCKIIINNPNQDPKEKLPTIEPRGMKVTVPHGGYNEVVVTGNPDTLQTIADSLGIETIDKCSCDEDIFLWKIPNTMSIENAISTVRRNSSRGVKGDVNINLTISSKTSLKFTKYQNSKIYNHWDNKKIIIAIVDTGLNIDLFKSEEINLLETSKYNELFCDYKPNTDKVSGWNFVNGNADVRNNNLHGTLVTKNLIRNLELSSKANVQILPLKVFNSAGIANYWDIVCAFSYIKSLKESGLDIAIINASFGGTLPEGMATIASMDDFLILKGFIDEMKNTSIVVASAGNEIEDNDVKPHFPSSYNSGTAYSDNTIIPSRNIISTAGYDFSSDGTFVELAKSTISGIGSNFGKQSVDVAAPWSYSLIDNVSASGGTASKEYIVEGTSYSSSYISSRLLDFIITKNPSERGETLLNSFLNNREFVKIQTSPNLLIKGSKYAE